MGERLVRALVVRFGTQAAAAQALGLYEQQVSRWARNPDKPPSEATIQRVAEATGATPWWIRYGIGDPPE